MIGIGAKVRFIPTALENERATAEERRAARIVAPVTYINWEHGYFLAEWHDSGHTFRESFSFMDIGKKVFLVVRC
jgi:hypothetical protein